jgi:hypothetical protein
MKQKFPAFHLAALMIILPILYLSCTAFEKGKKTDELMTYSHKNSLFNRAVLVASNGKIINRHTFGYSSFRAYQTQEALIDIQHDNALELHQLQNSNRSFLQGMAPFLERNAAPFVWRE